MIEEIADLQDETEEENKDRDGTVRICICQIKPGEIYRGSFIFVLVDPITKEEVVCEFFFTIEHPTDENKLLFRIYKESDLFFETRGFDPKTAKTEFTGLDPSVQVVLLTVSDHIFDAIEEQWEKHQQYRWYRLAAAWLERHIGLYDKEIIEGDVKANEHNQHAYLLLACR